ncbi:MAG: ComEA family DNA-binding protein [Candidatus Neomarinimicrobiota bacterium]
MPALTSQEKNLTIFLLSTVLIGSVIGIFRHKWPSTPKILLSPKNLPAYIKKNEETNIIEMQNTLIKENSQLAEVEIINKELNAVQRNSFVTSKSGDIENVNTAANKTESNKKKITQNPSGIININSASKEDFMTLPYIGEVKAGRIIQLRNEIGVFMSIKDLEKVKGIGPKTLAKLEPLITI